MITNSDTHQSDEIEQLQDIFATLRVQLQTAELRLQALNQTQDTSHHTDYPDTTGSPDATNEPPQDRNGQPLHTGDKVKFSATKVTRRGTGTISRFASNCTHVFVICNNKNGHKIQQAPHNMQLLSDNQTTE